MLIDAVLPFGSIDREFHVEEKEWETGKVFEKRWVFGIERRGNSRQGHEDL